MVLALDDDTAGMCSHYKSKVKRELMAQQDWTYLVGQPPAEELQEDPLRPAVVAGVGRAHLAVPVV